MDDGVAVFVNIGVAYALLGVVMFAAILGAALLLDARQGPAQVRTRVVLCQQETVGSPVRLTCSTGGAVDLYPDHHWQSAGPLTPTPGAPRG